MSPAAAPVVLIPAQPQGLWGWPAVVNFALGGMGAGLYLVAAVAANLQASPALLTAAWLGPALVGAGFAAVGAEAGRPARGPRVLRQVATSWMSREAWLGAAFAALALSEFVAPGRPRALAVAAAAGLALAQGLILRRARGVAAWDVSVMPLVFLVSALLSGLGLYALVEVAGGRTPSRALLGAFLVLLTLGLLVWLALVTWSSDPAFLEAMRPLRDGGTAFEIVGVGYLAPFALAALGLAFPAFREAAGALAGAFVVAGQLHAKATLILKAGQLRPITFPALLLSRRPS